MKQHLKIGLVFFIIISSVSLVHLLKDPLNIKNRVSEKHFISHSGFWEISVPLLINDLDPQNNWEEVFSRK